MIQIDKKEVEGLFKGRLSQLVYSAADEYSFAQNVAGYIETDRIKKSITLPPSILNLTP